MNPYPLEFSESGAAAASSNQAGVRLLRLSELSVEDHLRWGELSRAACHDSIYAAHWFVQSVLAHYDLEQRYRILAVVDENAGWIGVVVAARYSHLGQIPLRHLKGQLDANQFLGVPLVRPGCEMLFWAKLIGWLGYANLGCNGLRLSEMPSGHRVTLALTELCDREGRSLEILSSKSRAAWIHNGKIGSPVLQHLSQKRRSRLESLERQLRDLHGPLSVEPVVDAQQLDQCLSEFLALELAGWKGRKGSALASDSRSASHFRHIARMGFADGSFHMLVMRIGKRPIAMTSYFLKNGHGFGFKMAFDENFARFAPGILLVKALMQKFANAAPVHFDSCSDADAAMINELWPDRRHIVDLIVSVGNISETGRFRTAIAARRFWHKAKFWRKVAALASPF